MTETTNINVLDRAQNVDISKQLLGYTGVRIYVGTDDDGNDIVWFAGNEDGNVLEFENPFGTQQMANNILNDIRGYRYQPMEADTALLDPAAEIGDGVTVAGVYTGIFTRATQFGQLMGSNIGAPTKEEIEHELAMESPTDRQYSRFVKQMKASLSITEQGIKSEVSRVNEYVFGVDSQDPGYHPEESLISMISQTAGDITAKVDKKSPDSQTSFGWQLTNSQWKLFDQNGNILVANSNGLQVKGKITATSGQIGGFTIQASSICNNIKKINGTATTGVYIGTDGIQLGGINSNHFQVKPNGEIDCKNFKVSSSGIVTANAINLKGTLTFLNSDGSSAGTLTAASLRKGALDGFNWSNTPLASLGGSTAASYCSSAAGTWNTAQTTSGVIPHIYAQQFHSSSTSYFASVSTYYLYHYYTGRRYAPRDITIDGQVYSIWAEA